MSNNQPTDIEGSIVTSGTFDGIHAGHREVIADLKKKAAQHNLRPIVVTFDRHPLEVIAPSRVPLMIMDNRERNEIIRSLGVELHVIPFTDEVRHLTVADWFEELKLLFNAKIVLMGYDNTLGSDGRDMSFDEYKRLGKAVAIEVLRAPELPGISSSAIRKAISAGDLETAGRMLLRPFSFSGTVGQGEKLARQLGAPTANITLSPRQLLPPSGVYASGVTLPDGSRYKASLNIGRRPTVAVHGGEMSAEAHLIDFSGDLYDTRLKIEPKVKIRDEIRFNSIADLAARIKEDIEICKNRDI